MNCTLLAVYRTDGLQGYAVKFSPYNPNRVAVTACQQFGIAGSARLLVLDLAEGGLRPLTARDWKDALFDLAWSEVREGVVVCAGGDGTLIVWDLNNSSETPAGVWKEHSKEVYGVDWSITRDAQLVLTASWDTTVKLWDVEHGVSASLATFSGHTHVVYAAAWAPLVSACFASVSGDETLRVWDTRKPHMSQLVLPSPTNAEILCADWCKYDQNVLATGSTDGNVRVWDLRNPRQPTTELHGHKYAVRRVKFSPFSAQHIVSSSYDFTVRSWDWTRAGSQLDVIDHHSEFVYGLDCSTHTPGLVADCAWDQTVKVYRLAALQTLPPLAS